MDNEMIIIILILYFVGDSNVFQRKRMRRILQSPTRERDIRDSGRSLRCSNSWLALFELTNHCYVFKEYFRYRDWPFQTMRVRDFEPFLAVFFS